MENQARSSLSVQVEYSVRMRLLQEIIHFSFPGPGKMEEFIQGFEDLVMRYRLAGGDFKDQTMLDHVLSKLTPEYDPIVYQFDNDTKFAYARVKLIEWDTVLKMRRADPKPSEREAALMAQIEALKMELKNIKQGDSGPRFKRGKNGK